MESSSQMNEQGRLANSPAAITASEIPTESSKSRLASPAADSMIVGDYVNSQSNFHGLKTFSLIIIAVLILVAGVNIFTAIKRKATFSLIFNIIALLVSLSLCFILFHYFGQRTSYYPMMTT